MGDAFVHDDFSVGIGAESDFPVERLLVRLGEQNGFPGSEADDFVAEEFHDVGAYALPAEALQDRDPSDLIGFGIELVDSPRRDGMVV